MCYQQGSAVFFGLTEAASTMPELSLTEHIVVVQHTFRQWVSRICLEGPQWLDNIESLKDNRNVR